MHPTLPIFRFPARTLPGLLVHTARRIPGTVFIRFIDPADPGGTPREITFAALHASVARAAAYLRGVGVGPGDRVLLLAENAPEWQTFSLAAQALRAEPAALFSSLSAAAVQDIARRVRPRVAFVSAPQWAKLAPIAPELAAGGLVAVVSASAIGALPPGVAWADAAAVTADGAPAEDLDALAAAVGEEDPFLLLFTSGTTGRPKGVRLPQRAIVHAIEGGAIATGTVEADLGVHFLPFGHVAGHDQFAIALAQGHGLVMVARREDIERSLALHPTYLFSVPLVYERIRGGVEEKLAGLPAPARALARAALAAAQRVRVDGSRALRDRVLTRVADVLVGRAVRARLGGRIRGLFSGGAPATVATFRFFEALGIPFVELYGMSETAGLVSSNLFGGLRRAGAAGLVSPDHEVRIAEDGELLVRGPLLLSGYLEPEDAAGAYDPDGFFRTGDVARFDEEGLLRIAGRKKHLLVLSTGKKLSPEPIEQAIVSAAPFQGAVLVGEGRPFVSAAVFVAREELARLAAAGQDAAEELLPRVRAALAAFSEFEKPKRLLVIPGAPQDHPDLVTPTLKLRREAVLDRFGAGVARLYGAA
ncbi:AMP-dependent synthetase/ligase [Anaeromyxobacter oryzisoli]|uniref:AMP-dependent synthetase/ligase n=1 Tax=Anaeromyxobacter oryzisoli TaxID=2925408 RepID=UPI001F55EE0B|nr:AMP-binding protein [Anaeromyxobacter sp. SG63]